jgi:AcrR family transcriptional regulator
VAGTRGRQHEAALNDQKVLDAARLVFARDGFNAPVSAVAAEAGVGMGSLYRRYGSKVELLQQLCVLSMRQSIAAAERALADPDPSQGLRGYIVECVGFGAGAFAPLAGAIAVTDEMLSTAKYSHRLLARLLRRAQTAGTVRSDVNAVDISALIARFSRARADNSPDGTRLEDRVLTIALDGLARDEARQPLPRPPSRHRHAQLWNAPARPAG